MNNKLLIETLVLYKRDLNECPCYNNIDSAYIEREIENINTLLSELKEPSLEEKRAMFEADYEKHFIIYHRQFEKEDDYVFLHNVFIMYCIGKGWEV